MFCKKKKNKTKKNNRFLYISKKEKKIKEYFNKTFEKKHVKELILSKAAGFLCKTKT